MITWAIVYWGTNHGYIDRIGKDNNYSTLSEDDVRTQVVDDKWIVLHFVKKSKAKKKRFRRTSPKGLRDWQNVILNRFLYPWRTKLISSQDQTAANLLFKKLRENCRSDPVGR
jgi:tRNA uridine 5-carbamoylmethylation protein Kti12